MSKSPPTIEQPINQTAIGNEVINKALKSTDRCMALNKSLGLDRGRWYEGSLVHTHTLYCDISPILYIDSDPKTTKVTAIQSFIRFLAQGH